MFASSVGSITRRLARRVAWHIRIGVCIHVEALFTHWVLCITRPLWRALLRPSVFS
jgi:hypothetical protein